MASFVTSGWRAVLRAGLLCLVLGLAAIYHQQIADAARQLTRLRPIVVIVIPLFLAWTWTAAAGWRRLVRAVSSTGAAPSSWTLALIRIQGQALNWVVPTASVGGELLRSGLLFKRIGHVAESAAAVVMDNLASTCTGVVFSLAWLTIERQWYPRNAPPLAMVIPAGIAVAAGLTVGALVAGRRRASLRRLATGYAAAVAWHFGERMLTAGEIYVAMRALGIEASASKALFATAMMTGLSTVFFFIPGQIGAAEFGLAAAFAAIGLPAEDGLAVALVRRSRQALVMLGGVALLARTDRTPRALAR